MLAHICWGASTISHNNIEVFQQITTSAYYAIVHVCNSIVSFCCSEAAPKRFCPMSDYSVTWTLPISLQWQCVVNYRVFASAPVRSTNSHISIGVGIGTVYG
jgi:hypothetical protein